MIAGEMAALAVLIGIHLWPDGEGQAAETPEPYVQRADAHMPPAISAGSSEGELTMVPHKAGSTPGLVKAGSWLECQAGFWAAFVYLSGYVFLLLAPSFLNAIFTGQQFSITQPELGLIGLIYGIGSLVSLVPALTIGALTGAMIGQALAWTKTSLTAGRAWLLGSLICLGAGLLIHALMWFLFYRNHPFGLNLLSAPGYVFMLGIPSLIYIVIGGWLSVRLYSRMKNYEKRGEA